MSELIQKYQFNPIEENKNKLARYIKQRPLAISFATSVELKLLKKWKII